MTELIAIRHGETDANREHRFQGHFDAPLNAQGLAQAERLGQRLATERLDAIVSSDLARARRTADAVLAARDGRGPDTVACEPRWREQSFGELEGRAVAQVQRDRPELWARWLRHDADEAMPGGETARQFLERIAAALEALRRAHAGARVALVTHGGVLDMIWRVAHDLPAAGFRAVAIPNAGINRLRFAAGRWQVDGWGDASHLEGLPPPLSPGE